jgi:hypothetical protein
VGHILGGYDHLLFLLALLLVPASGWAILRIITAFTLAHSVTLALSALQILQLPGALVEATIAASIAYVAGENFFRRQPGRHRVVVTLINAMEQRNAKRGMAALCIGGGEGIAMAIERA